ncbi:MAG TPA: hypothetical protein VGC76_11175 [Pyrinomonadaceae bacterium]|jgi:hypothetical protein
MAQTVEIIIKGAGIGYQKDDYYHVIFPVDAEGCHKVNFSFQKDGEDESTAVSLAKSKAIDISAPGATSIPGADEEYNNFVYDLTSPTTHPRIRMKSEPGKFTLLKVPNAQLSVNKFFLPPIPDLVEVGNPANRSPIAQLAQSVKATITLDDGGQVNIDADEFSFSTDAGASCILIFDNDCDEVIQGQNDMDMYYEVIEEFDTGLKIATDKRFHIGGLGNLSGLSKETLESMVNSRFFKDPPDLAQGKNCLKCKVTDAESIRHLP